MKETTLPSEMCIAEAGKCLFCGGSDNALWVKASDQFEANAEAKYIYVRCRACSLVWLTNPPDAAQLAEHYPDESYWHDPGTAKSLISRLEEIYRRILFTTEITRTMRFIDCGKMLDVGCGSGYVAGLYKKRGFAVTGIDISEHALRIARECYGVDCAHGNFSADRFEKNSFDFVNMDYFLEHIPDPMRALADARAILRDGGILRLAIPNAESLQFKMFGKRWFNIEAPRHLYIFTPQVITKMLAANGLQLIHIDHFSIKTNPVVCASSFSLRLNPHKIVASGFGAKLALLALTWLCAPFTGIESALHKGATIVVFARKTA